VPSAGRGVRHRGLTLIELLTTLALAAILLTLGVPAFNEVMARHRMTTAANGLLADVHLARSEALKRGVRVALCTGGETGSGFACSADGDWHQGYLIFIDPDANLAVEDASEVMRAVAGSASAPVQITSDRQGIAFLADGTADIAADSLVSWSLCISGSASHAKAVSVARSGRANVATATCP